MEHGAAGQDGRDRGRDLTEVKGAPAMASAPGLARGDAADGQAGMPVPIAPGH